MTSWDFNAVRSLLGARVSFVEDLGSGGFADRSGRVVAVIEALPGSCCDVEFCLEQDDGDVCYYGPTDRILEFRLA